MATVHHHLTATTIPLASPLIPSNCTKINRNNHDNAPTTKSVGLAPIVVSELDEDSAADDMLLMSVQEDAFASSETEDVSAEQRDDLEELHDFQSLLMPAARESAARRLNSLNNSGNGDVKQQSRHHMNTSIVHPLRRQRNPQQQRVKSPFVSKFPVIDEDLLALATRKAGNGHTAASEPPPNLCRLITNVSECRWTAKRPSIVSSSLNDGDGSKMEQKENDNELIEETMVEDGRVTKIILRKEDTLKQQIAIHEGKANGLLMPMASNAIKAKTASDVVALHRLSALSMVSSVSSNGFGTAADDAANCDCTSLAMSAFRRSSYNGRSQKRRKQLEQRQTVDERQKGAVADLDDSYRKIYPSTSSTISMTTAATALGETSGSSAVAGTDSGISSSSDSSRSTSLSDNANNGVLQQKITPNTNCLKCGRKYLPPAVSNSTKSPQQLLSRRRRALNYLLGNMMRFLQQDMSAKKCCQCQRCGINLKLMTVTSTTLTSASSVMNTKVPLINIEMVNDSQTDSPKSSPRDGGGSATSTPTAEENRNSPRWRSDFRDEAVLPAYNKKEVQLRPQKPHKTAEEAAKRDSSPTKVTSQKTMEKTDKNHQQSQNAAALSLLASAVEKQCQPLQNGHNNKISTKEATIPKESPTAKNSSSTLTMKQQQKPFTDAASLLVSPNASKLTAKEETIGIALAPPPAYQQAIKAEQKKREEENMENAYAVAVKRSRIAGRLAGIAKFHFPSGKPIGKADNDKRLAHIRELFDSQPAGQLPLSKFDELCKRMDFAVYTKRAVYDACCKLNDLPVLPPLTAAGGQSGNNGGEGASTQAVPAPDEAASTIDFNQFCVYWNRMINDAHDESARFVFTLYAASSRFSPVEKAGNNQHLYLLREDFLPMMMDLILTHPGLHFLKDAPQFYSKYCEVVIVRIYWNVNRSWTGKISANELRRSNFLQTLRSLEEVTDINKVTEYFSYEHFYVTYCKFWELDNDHDMVISREDMRRHCNGALTDRIIDRVFSAAVIRTPAEQRTVAQPGPIRQQPIETIGFEDFVCFLLAEEDKRHPTSLEYWFRCVDLDGDGQISLYEMEYFYEAIEQKLMSKNMETLALRDVICNLLDSISPTNGYSITRNDLKKSGLAHRFFNTFVNWIKYVDQESSDGERASVKTTGDKEISDWEMFCLTEYELLMAETEQMSNEGDVEENIDVILDDEEEEHQLVSEEREQRLNGFLQQKQIGKAAAN